LFLSRSKRGNPIGTGILYIYRGVLLIDMAQLDTKGRRKSAWDIKSTKFTRKTTSNLRTIEEVNVAGIEKSDYEVRA
jgi:hypothetical protein